MAKKEWNEKELYDLAKDIYYVAQVIHLTDIENDDFDWEYFQNRLYEAMEIISPKFVQDCDDEWEEGFGAYLADTEINKTLNELKDEKTTKGKVVDLAKWKEEHKK